MNIYVYQIDDNSFGAGFIEAVCARRGKVVETWPVDTQTQIDFVKRHGSAFGAVYHQVKDLACRAERCRDDDFKQFDEEREAVLLELAALPFKTRLKAGLQVIWGRYQEIENVAQGNN